MRRNIKDIWNGDNKISHAGLAYEVWLPVEEGTGKIPDDEKDKIFEKLESIGWDADYREAFERWRGGFDESELFVGKLVSRLLVGHGNPSPTEVGLTLHHTWGVPFIPGSALKGLVSHYVDAVYGPGEEGEDADESRLAYRGVTWKGRTIKRGPGWVYRALFGAPDAEEDSDGEGAARGLVEIHDALMVPEMDAKGNPEPFLAQDVLTVHQKEYYNNDGKDWPNDYDSPNPVSFLTVKPGVKFLFAVTGPKDWRELAVRFLKEALAEWGVGGKTAAGYGRIVVAEP